MHRVVGVERDAVNRLTLAVFAGLDVNPVWVIGAHFVQRNDVCHHQAQQHQGHGNHVEAEEAIECGVAHHVVTADQQSQVGADEGNGRKQVNDDLRTPVRHLAPRQQVTHKGFGH